jgi:rhodanese-related sulfurtransferase
MKRFATVTLAAALIAPAISHAQTPSAPAQQAAQPAFAAKVLKRADLDALLKQPAKVLILDVRRPDELQSIGGFPVYLSIQASDLEKHLAYIPKDRTIVTVSNHASRAGRAADLLTKHGFTVAGAAGAQDYEAEGGALVKVAPRAANANASR